jgi:predicted MFS family arabinose efflux permease
MAGVLAFIGIVGGGLNPMLVTIRHQRIPPGLRGRVFSTFSAIASGGQPLGAGLGGTAVERLGLVPTALLLGACAQLVGVGLVFVPALSEFDQDHARRSV